MAIRMVEKNGNDDLDALPSRIRSPSQSPPRSPFMTALLRRQSKNDQTRCNFKEHRRIVVFGSAKVGKSAIIRQFLYDQFCERYTRTVEDLFIAEYNLSNGASLTLEILDTTGSYQFPAMRALSISNGGAFILAYSVDDEDSWNEIKELRRQIIYVRGPDVPIVIVGTKVDLKPLGYKVDYETVKQTTTKWRCGFIECSAKENIRIVDVFEEVL